MSAENRTVISHCSNCGQNCADIPFQKWQCHCGAIQLACSECTSSEEGAHACLALVRQHKKESHPIWRN